MCVFCFVDLLWMYCICVVSMLVCVCVCAFWRTESNFVRFLKEKLWGNGANVCVQACVCLFLLFSLFDIIVDFVLICLHFHLCCSFFSPLVVLNCLVGAWIGLPRADYSRWIRMTHRLEKKNSQPTHWMPCIVLILASAIFLFLNLISVRR